jgi:hypothetical protein
VVQVEKSKISGCAISLQAAVHPGELATGTQHLKESILKSKIDYKQVVITLLVLSKFVYI